MNKVINSGLVNVALQIVVLSTATLFLIGCANQPLNSQVPLLGSASTQESPILGDLQEREVVSGIWLFEDEQLEIKIARVDGAEQLPSPNQNATRFIIQSANEKLVSYSTQRFRVDGLERATAYKTGAAGMSANDERDQAIQTTFRGSVVMHAGIPVELTLQNTDIDDSTPNVYSRLRMMLTERNSNGTRSLNSTIDCVSFPEFQCTRSLSPQSASN